MKFLSPEVGLYVYKSTIQPCMEYCFQVWADAASCYLDMWDNYRNGYVGLLVQHMLPPLKPWLIIEMLRALVFPVFGLCSSELAELDPLSYLGWRSTHYPNRLYDFAVTISRCYKDVYINNFLTQLDPGILYLPNAFL